MVEGTNAMTHNTKTTRDEYSRSELFHTFVDRDLKAILPKVSNSVMKADVLLIRATLVYLSYIVARSVWMGTVPGSAEKIWKSPAEHT